jgi:hypothetical protein
MFAMSKPVISYGLGFPYLATNLFNCFVHGALKGSYLLGFSLVPGPVIALVVEVASEELLVRGLGTYMQNILAVVLCYEASNSVSRFLVILLGLGQK